jgi:branched-chain amino acid transport system permease protein
VKSLRLPFALVVLVVLPALLSPSLLNAAIQMLIAVLFASAFNLLSGQGGMLSFGHSAYFGIGAFATVHAMGVAGSAHLLPTPLLPLAGGCGGFLLGVVAGWFSTQRSGVYFSMITLALAELLQALAPHLSGFFGGEAGVSSMRMPAWGLSFESVTQVYYLTLAWVVLSLVLLYFLTRTPVGRLTLALRENSQRLRFLGYEVHRLRVLVFALSAMFSGIAGGLLAVNNETANYVLFDMHLSAEVVLNTYIGGVSVFLGPALGAAVMTFFGYAVSDLTRSWLLYQGVLFVLVMMFMPSGMTGLLRWWSERRAKHSIGELLPAVCATLIAAVFVAAGTVFTVELAQRIFAEEYRALSAVAGADPWPRLMLFGRSWSPASLFTWAIPAVLFGAGALAGKASSFWWRRLDHEKDADLSFDVEASPPGKQWSKTTANGVTVKVSPQTLNKVEEK